jgi:hypothetical protein
VTGDGATDGQHSDAAREMWKRIGRVPKYLEQPVWPELPVEVAHIWHWFSEIIAGCDGSGWGPAIVSWSSIDSWSRLTGKDLEPWECRALVSLGVLRANILAERDGAADKN